MSSRGRKQDCHVFLKPQLNFKNAAFTILKVKIQFEEHNDMNMSRNAGIQKRQN
jgi:hypothetical protein